MKKSFIYIGVLSSLLTCVSGSAFAAAANIPNIPNTPTVAQQAQQAKLQQTDLRSLSDTIPKYTAQDADAEYNKILAQVQAMQHARQAQNAAALNPNISPSQNNNAPSTTQGAVSTDNSTRLAAQAPRKRLSGSDVEFIKMLDTMNPLTPEQIRMMHAMYAKVEEAKNFPASAQAPKINSININLAPGEVPPSISLSANNISTMVFLDSTGQPWPIVSVANANPTNYSVTQPPVSKDNGLANNVLMLKAKKDQSKNSNVVVLLKGLNTPIIFSLLVGQKNVSVRTDVHVTGNGPNALVSVDAGATSVNDAQLMSALNGVTPTNAKMVVLQGCPDCQAWQSDDVLYLRTKRRLLSPSWIQSTSSADGTSAYKLPRAPVLLTFADGKISKVNVNY